MCIIYTPCSMQRHQSACSKDRIPTFSRMGQDRVLKLHAFLRGVISSFDVAAFWPPTPSLRAASDHCRTYGRTHCTACSQWIRMVTRAKSVSRHTDSNLPDSACDYDWSPPGCRQQAVIAPPVSQIAHGNQYTGGKRQGAIGTLKHIVINAAQPIGVLSVLCMQIMSACALLRIGRVTSVQSCTDLGA